MNRMNQSFQPKFSPADPTRSSSAGGRASTFTHFGATSDDFQEEKEMLLQVKDLRVHFDTSNGEVHAVRGVSFDLRRGDIVGVVGESGSGKSVMSMSILRLLPDNAIIDPQSSVIYQGEQLLALPKKHIRKVRGHDIAMIFQDPISSLNPLMKVGDQVAEMIKVHNRSASKRACREEAINLLKRVRIPSPERRYHQYPHELSGGMRQRVMIAIAIANRPVVLIADEPTTALDVTIQQQILNLIYELHAEDDIGVLFITHDLAVVAELCTRVLVMYGGQILEEADVVSLFNLPMHPYTLGLLGSLPSLNPNREEDLLSIPGSPPDMRRPPVACPFAPRCPYAMNICDKVRPPRFELAPQHYSRCWLLSPDAPSTGNPLTGGRDIVRDTIKGERA